MIIRATKRDRFTRVSNTLIEDDSLSLEALGALVWLLSKPDNWQLRRHVISRKWGIGREKTARILEELKRAGT